jgi:hypothetical protein
VVSVDEVPKSDAHRLRTAGDRSFLDERVDGGGEVVVDACNELCYAESIACCNTRRVAT